MEHIFKWFTEESGDTNSRAYLFWFVKNFRVSDFTGIDKLFYCFLSYCSFLKITPKKKFLEAYLDVDAKEDIKKYDIHVDTMQGCDYRDIAQFEEAVSVIKGVAISAYDLRIAEDLSDKDFKVEIYKFMSDYKSAAISQTFMEYYPKLTDGSDVDEVSKQLRLKLNTIDADFNTDKIKEINPDITEDTDEDQMKYIANTGLPCIDGDIGGIYTKLIYTLNAQPGGGKTRMSLANFVYPCLVDAGKDVIYIETELSKGQVINILVAHHIIKLYGGKVKIPDSVMNKKDGMSEEQLRIYNAAKLDLFNNPKYGKFIFKDNSNVCELEDEIETSLASCDNPGMLCIDYMGLLTFKSPDKFAHMDGYEIITEGYKIARKLVLKHDIVAVCINQYNDKGVEAAYAGKPIRSGYVQGGHIVQRHTDYDLSMTFTEEQKLARVRMLSVSKGRGSKGFSNIMLRVDLSVSLFIQKQSMEES